MDGVMSGTQCGRGADGHDGRRAADGHDGRRDADEHLGVIGCRMAYRAGVMQDGT